MSYHTRVLRTHPQAVSCPGVPDSQGLIKAPADLQQHCTLGHLFTSAQQGKITSALRRSGSTCFQLRHLVLEKERCWAWAETTHQVVVLGAEAAAEDMVRVALQGAQALLGPHIPQLQRAVVRGCAEEFPFPVPAHIRQSLQQSSAALSKRLHGLLRLYKGTFAPDLCHTVDRAWHLQCLSTWLCPLLTE